MAGRSLLQESESKAGLHRIDAALVWAGFTQLVPISAFVTAFGAAFGLAATQHGLDDVTTIAMSALVFAGAAQFAALELWGTDVPLLAVMITVFAINARHLLMGATLYPWLRCLPPGKRYGIMVVISDANWAMAMQRFERGKPGFGVVLGGGLGRAHRRRRHGARHTCHALGRRLHDVAGAAGPAHAPLHSSDVGVGAGCLAGTHGGGR